MSSVVSIKMKKGTRYMPSPSTKMGSTELTSLSGRACKQKKRRKQSGRVAPKGVLIRLFLPSLGCFLRHLYFMSVHFVFASQVLFLNRKASKSVVRASRTESTHRPMAPVFFFYLDGLDLFWRPVFSYSWTMDSTYFGAWCLCFHLHGLDYGLDIQYEYDSLVPFCHLYELDICWRLFSHIHGLDIIWRLVVISFFILMGSTLFVDYFPGTRMHSSMFEL